jgi:DNA-binding CsgD family transcriptional regulator
LTITEASQPDLGPKATAYLVMTNVPAERWVALLAEQPRVIGRGAGAQVQVPPEFTHVSRGHAEVWANKEGQWIRDLDSTSGTRVNGVPLAPRETFRLILGDHLWLGAAEFDLVSNPDLSRRRPFPKSEDETIGYGTGPGGTVKFCKAPAHFFLTLTPTELDVVLWLSRGYTDLDEVAETLYRSPHTIRSHQKSIFAKLGVHSRDELLSCLLRRISASGDNG